MAVTIGDSEHRILSGPGSGDTFQTFSMTITGSGKGIVVLWTAGAVGGTNIVVGASIGGVAHDFADSIVTSGGQRRSGVFVIEDISGRSNDTVTVEITPGADWYNLWVGVINASNNTIQAYDSGTADVPGFTTGTVSLDTDGQAALALGAGSGGGASFSPAGSEVNLWATDFFGILRSTGDYISFTGSTNFGYYSNSTFALVAVAVIEVYVPPDFEEPYIPGEPHLC